MRVKGLLGLALRLLESILVLQLLCLVSLSKMNRETPLPEKPIEMLFAHLNRAKRAIPLATFPFARCGLHLLYPYIREGHGIFDLRHLTSFFFPTNPR